MSLTQRQADRMASRLLRCIQAVEKKYTWDFQAMPLRHLERLSDWYGRLVWLDVEPNKCAQRQFILDAVRKSRLAEVAA